MLSKSDYLQKIISCDDNYVYVDTEAFERLLDENNIDGEVNIVFGGIQSLNSELRQYQVRQRQIDG